jgi:hypothetical protein
VALDPPAEVGFTGKGSATSCHQGQSPCICIIKTGLWDRSGEPRSLIGPNRAFEHLEQAVLDPQPHILSARPAHPQFVDFVNEDDPPLSSIEVAIGSLDQPEQQALHVLAHVTRFSQARGIANGERDVQIRSQGLDQICLAAAGRTDEQDVGLLDSYIVQVGICDDRIGTVTVPGVYEPLEVAGDAQGEPPLGEILSDDELIEVTDDAFGSGD